MKKNLFLMLALCFFGGTTCVFAQSSAVLSGLSGVAKFAQEDETSLISYDIASQEVELIPQGKRTSDEFGRTESFSGILKVSPRENTPISRAKTVSGNVVQEGGSIDSTSTPVRDVHAPLTDGDFEFLIIGSDDRSPANADGFGSPNPFIRVGRIWALWPDGSETVQTGTLISQRQVLTAGQTVFDPSRGGFAAQVYFSPGQSGDPLFDPIFNTNFRRSDGQTYGEARATALRALNGWINDGNVEFNMGLVQLDRNIGDTVGWWGYGFDDDDSFFTTPPGVGGWFAPGYATDLDVGGFEQYQSLGGVFDVVQANLLFIDSIDVCCGAVGASTGQWISGFAGNIFFATSYGVFGAEATGLNGFVRMTGGIFANFQDLIASDGPAVDLPDLVDEDQWNDSSFASMSTSDVSPGDNFSVTAFPYNIGTATSGSYTVSFYASTNTIISTFDTFLGSTTISGTSPLNFSFATISTTFPTISDGDYYVGWIIDSGNSITEYEESNNNGLISDELLTVTTTGGGPPPTVGTIDIVGFNFFAFEDVAPLAGTADFLEVTYDGVSDIIINTFFGGANGFDTEIGLYDAAGNLIASNDDAGGSLQSRLVLKGLSAGTYYLAAGTFNTFFNPGFDVTSTGGDANFCVDFFTFAEDIVLGDLNGDGAVTLLDVAPFVDALTFDIYSPEADVNCDGVVTLLDNAVFVSILQGN